MEKYPALKPELNLKTRYEQIDIDYLNKLTEEEKAWLNKFMEEYVNASFQHKNVIQKSSKHKKDSYDRNNSRNRDILTRAKATGLIVSISDITEDVENSNDNEDLLISKLDLDGREIEEELMLVNLPKKSKKPRNGSKTNK